MFNILVEKLLAPTRRGRRMYLGVTRDRML